MGAVSTNVVERLSLMAASLDSKSGWGDQIGLTVLKESEPGRIVKTRMMRSIEFAKEVVMSLTTSSTRV